MERCYELSMGLFRTVASSVILVVFVYVAHQLARYTDFFVVKPDFSRRVFGFFYSHSSLELFCFFGKKKI